MMKLIAIITICLGLFFMAECNEVNSFSSCDVMEKIFSERIFYEVRSMNLSYFDTIRVFDVHNSLKNCRKKIRVSVNPKILNKAYSFDGVMIKSVQEKVLIIYGVNDSLPSPMETSGWQSNRFKSPYKNSFVLQQFNLENERIFISLFRLGSNHQVDVTYKKEKHQLVLFDYSVGQY